MLINNVNARNNATDISNIENVVGSTCFDFATNFLSGAGTCNKILIFSPPCNLCSYLPYHKPRTLSLVKLSF